MFCRAEKAFHQAAKVVSLASSKQHVKTADRAGRVFNNVQPVRSQKVVGLPASDPSPRRLRSHSQSRRYRPGLLSLPAEIDHTVPACRDMSSSTVQNAQSSMHVIKGLHAISKRAHIRISLDKAFRALISQALLQCDSVQALCNAVDCNPPSCS